MLGQKIRQARKEKKISLSALARMANISKGYLCQFETKKEHQNIGVQTLCKICSALEMDIKEVVGC